MVSSGHPNGRVQGAAGRGPAAPGRARPMTGLRSRQHGRMKRIRGGEGRAWMAAVLVEGGMETG